VVKCALLKGCKWDLGACRLMDEHRFMDVSKLMHCGVYALLRGKEVIYIGKSRKPLIRLYTHFRNRGRLLGKGITGPNVNGKGISFDGVWFLPCMLGQMDTLENYMIRKYMPQHNVKGKPLMAIPDDVRELLTQMMVITGLPQEDSPKVYIRRML